MPFNVVGAVELVATAGFTMKEFFGNFSSKDGRISAAHENFIEADTSPPWRCSEFTEYILMMAGEGHVEHNSDKVVVKAGAGVRLPAGCRLRITFPEPSELVSICLPAINDATYHALDVEALAPAHATSTTPTLVDAVDVAKGSDLTITEFFGNVASKDGNISARLANVEKACSGAWQKPEFEEWVVVLNGTLHLEHADGVTKVPAGSGVFLAVDERVKLLWPEPCTYVSICMPAFTPEGCQREPEEGSAKDADP
eukprot:TRINITY_DN63279_c0_g1_i1.p2 TRINITY_DN63279_c0_g1~~TRINITY_DN63279_c0_g1_i1.p2  ORF type:complete len:255 (-),score=41.90 TRINITY_DN63279_c0_g1_i1:136-900(-)